ncbi:MAG: hypothetical protein ABJD53_10125 [Gammaproteobacteria bacterium]
MNATVALESGRQTENRFFYMSMAAAFVLVAFGGFSPTYWAPVVAGKFHAPYIIHIHGMLMFAWTCFFFVQTALVATGRIMDHRAWGLAGISLFSVLAVSILVGEQAVLARGEALGFGDAARRFAAVTLCAWPLLVTLFALAIINIRQPQVHKRLMMLLMTGMMTPAIARVFITLFAAGAPPGPPPPLVSLPPALVADLLLVAAMVHDWRNRGKPHSVYVIGGTALLLQQVLTVPFAATKTWMSLAKAFQGLAG